MPPDHENIDNEHVMPLTVERGWDYLHINLQDDTQHDAAQVVDHVQRTAPAAPLHREMTRASDARLGTLAVARAPLP
jgi:hypothetical protein